MQNFPASRRGLAALSPRRNSEMLRSRANGGGDETGRAAAREGAGGDSRKRYQMGETMRVAQQN